MSLSEKALEPRSQPLLLVVMGVSGTGKSTLATNLQDSLDLSI